MVKFLRNGPAVVVLAFILWGLIPLFYQYLSGGALAEILMYRVFWSIPLLLPIRLLFRKRTFFRDLLKDKTSFISCMIAGLLMVISWSAFIYALTNHKVLDASLGYFINPLIVICLGCIFLKEKPSLFQLIAVISGACGLGYQIISSRFFLHKFKVTMTGGGMLSYIAHLRTHPASLRESPRQRTPYTSIQL